MRFIHWLMAAAVLVCGGCVREPVDRRPNIVLIAASDLGYSDLSPYGGEISTPSLDQLAQQGQRFTRYYINDSAAATRASVLTGAYPQVAMDASGALRKEAATAGDLLADGGYATYSAGDSSSAEMSLDAITDQAVEHIRASIGQNQPFLLVVVYQSADPPAQALEEDIARYRGDYAAGWDEVRTRRHARLVEFGMTPAEWEPAPRPGDAPPWNRVADAAAEQKRMEAHAARIERIDRGVGGILRALEESGQRDNSFILFQGLSAAGRGSLGSGWASAANAPFQGFQGDALEGGIRAPLIVDGPGIGEAAIVDDVAHAIDIAPTLLDIAVRRAPRTREGTTLLRMEGKSLRPVFVGEGRRGHDALFWKSPQAEALRRDRWKMVRRPGELWRLFDITADGTELHDQAAGQSRDVEQLERLFQAWESRPFQSLLQ